MRRDFGPICPCMRIGRHTPEFIDLHGEIVGHPELNMRGHGIVDDLETIALSSFKDGH